MSRHGAEFAADLVYCARLAIASLNGVAVFKLKFIISQLFWVFSIFVFKPQLVYCGTLEDLISRAVQGHPSVLEKRLFHAAASDDVEGAYQQFFPTPSVGLSSDSSGSGNQGSISVRQPLWFISGVQKPQYEKARFIEGAAEWAVVELRDEVAQSVVSAYSDWVRAVARIEVGKSDAIYYGQLLGMITRRIMSGASAEVEKRLVTSRLLMAISERTANPAAERASREKLSQLVQSQVTYEELKRGVATVPYLPSMEELRQLVVLRNPTLHRLSKEGEALIVDSEVQRQALLPQLYVSAERLYAENNSANSDDSVLSVGVEWSPGAGFSTRSAISSAERRAEALQASRAAAQQELEENIHNLYVQLQSTLERQALIEENYRNQLQVRDSYLRQFMSGRRSWQEVMNAVRDVSDSQYSQADIRSQLITLGYRLGIQAYGDGFKPLDGDYSEIGLGERLL